MDIESALRVGRHLVIPPAELEWRFSASGGPGGQHANTANTRVELIFDVAGSAVLGPRQRARLLEHLEPSARVVVVDESSSGGQPARWSGRGTFPRAAAGSMSDGPCARARAAHPWHKGRPPGQTCAVRGELDQDLCRECAQVHSERYECTAPWARGGPSHDLQSPGALRHVRARDDRAAGADTFPGDWATQVPEDGD